MMVILAETNFLKRSNQFDGKLRQSMQQNQLMPSLKVIPDK